jgi:MFS family permease
MTVVGRQSSVAKHDLHWRRTMYQAESARTALREGKTATRPWYRLGSGVLLLGATSLLTDISSEMIVTILPAYLLLGLRLAPFQVGLIDGLYQSASVLVRFASGLAVDHFRAPKWIATAGYALSALSRIGLLAFGASGFGPLAAMITLDRIGKGIRTSPRDAMIAASVEPAHLGAAFGVHRAMDTVGAMLGPLLAFAILSITRQSFQTVFIVSLCFAVLGVATLALFVPGDLGGGAAAKRLSLRSVLAELRNPRYRSALIGASLLAAFTLSEGLIFLNLQRKLELSPAVIPLLFVGSALVNIALSVPIGVLSDRVGRARVFAAGHIGLAAVYLLLLAPRVLPDAPVAVWLEAGLIMALLGAYYAASDGVISAQVSALVDQGARGTAIALLATGLGVGHLIASTTFGALWSGLGSRAALGLFALGIVCVTAAFVFINTRKEMRDVSSQERTNE